MIKIPKAAIRRIEVATRQQMREKHKDSAFMRKSLNIYNGQCARMASNGGQLPYTIDEFRTWLRPFTLGKCPSCSKKLTIKGLTVDHEWPVARGGAWTLANLVVRCYSCNWRKGKLLPSEYARLLELLDSFTEESRTDVFRRLTLGGKWSFKANG